MYCRWMALSTAGLLWNQCKLIFSAISGSGDEVGLVKRNIRVLSSRDCHACRHEQTSQESELRLPTYQPLTLLCSEVLRLVQSFATRTACFGSRGSDSFIDGSVQTKLGTYSLSLLFSNCIAHSKSSNCLINLCAIFFGIIDQKAFA